MGSVRATVAYRFTLCLAIGALILTVPSVANAQLASHGGAAASFAGAGLSDPWYEQLDACSGGPASQLFPDFGNAVLQSADDFTIGGPETIVEILAPGGFFNGTGPFEDISYEVYDDDGPGGFPGSLLCAEAGLVNAGGLGDPVIQVIADGSCTVDGTSWFSMLPIMSFGVGGQWGWNVNASANGSEFVFRDPTDLLGSGTCLDWGFGVSQCGIGVAEQDLCFGLGNEPTTGDGGDGGGVPAVGTTGAIVMLLVVMAVSFFFLRRRQTA